MNSCLWVVPMEALYFILKYERVVFCSHNLLKISQVVSWISNLLGRMTAVLQWISKQYFQLVTEGIQEIIRWITYCLKCGSVNRDPLLVCNSINHVIIYEFPQLFLKFWHGVSILKFITLIKVANRLRWIANNHCQTILMFPVGPH